MPTTCRSLEQIMRNRLHYLRNVATLQFFHDKCTGCGMCMQVCPHGVFRRDNGKVRLVDRDLCMECGACEKNCPAGAVTVVAGVGCAAAVINAALGRNSACCCCIIEPASAETGNAEAPTTKGTGCC